MSIFSRHSIEVDMTVSIDEWIFLATYCALCTLNMSKKNVLEEIYLLMTLYWNTPMKPNNKCQHKWYTITSEPLTIEPKLFHLTFAWVTIFRLKGIWYTSILETISSPLLFSERVLLVIYGCAVSCFGAVAAVGQRWTTGHRDSPLFGKVSTHHSYW